MKKIDNKWVDENNNSWNCDYYSKQKAEKLSKTMIGCSDCSDCSYCSHCSNCSDFKDNPLRYVTKFIGSRNAQTTIYWNNDNIKVITGCFKGDLNSFKEKVLKTHANNDVYLNQYLKEIKIMQYLINATK